MACADADGLFTTIDVGEIGRNSDGAVFRTSNLGHALQLGLLELPQPRPLPLGNDDFPFYFAADEAFPLKKLYNETLFETKRVFNYRLSRGRRSVECAFGMLVSKFRLFEGPICCKEETINSVIKAACVLHNFIRIKQGIFTQPTETIADRQDQVHIPIEPMPQPQIIRNHSEAQNIRERLCDYFLTLLGLYHISGITFNCLLVCGAPKLGAVRGVRWAPGGPRRGAPRSTRGTSRSSPPAGGGAKLISADAPSIRPPPPPPPPPRYRESQSRFMRPLSRITRFSFNCLGKKGIYARFLYARMPTRALLATLSENDVKISDKPASPHISGVHLALLASNRKTDGI
ncbi:hypothetical protein NQ318_000380 [Aromia moschata]|uniref:DDE Tnp4 domain-containing protein n=1 Tax=Aromia moschata TaxID=1265417 RepID=A0AAV8YU01_9CUCU|nr:hypothetical protein NQ318_000380 [Aromia moschata]